jgi:hypothetical protein
MVPSALLRDQERPVDTAETVFRRPMQYLAILKLSSSIARQVVSISRIETIMLFARLIAPVIYRWSLGEVQVEMEGRLHQLLYIVL